MWPAQNRPVHSLLREPALLLTQPACLAGHSPGDTPGACPSGLRRDAGAVLLSWRQRLGYGGVEGLPEVSGLGSEGGSLAPNRMLACISLKVKVGLRTGLGQAASCPLSSVVAAATASLCPPPTPQTPGQEVGIPLCQCDLLRVSLRSTHNPCPRAA